MFGNDSCPKYAIKDVFMLQMGKTPPRKELELWDNGIYKWISIADIGKYGKYTGDTSEKLSQKAVTATGIKIVPENTVLMSFKLTVGKTVITSEPVYTNEAIMAFINKNKLDVNNDYLRYWLAFYNWAKDSNNAVCGITLNKEIIGNTLIDIPDIELQNKFGDFVQQVDKSKFHLPTIIRNKN